MIQVKRLIRVGTWIKTAAPSWHRQAELNNRGADTPLAPADRLFHPDQPDQRTNN